MALGGPAVADARLGLLIQLDDDGAGHRGHVHGGRRHPEPDGRGLARAGRVPAGTVTQLHAQRRLRPT